MAASMYASRFRGYHLPKTIKVNSWSNLATSCRYLSSRILPSSVKGRSFHCYRSDNYSQHLSHNPSSYLSKSDLTTLSFQSVFNYRSLQTSNHSNQFSKQVPLNRTSDANPPHRNYSGDGDDNSPDKKVVMHLMNFPEIVWPSLIKSLRNWILSNLIITPYFDREFSLPEFTDGAKKAFEFVTECLSESSFDKLEGLVSPEAIEELKLNISLFSVQKRQELRMLPDDIYFSFPYQVGVMFSGDDEDQKRFVEITMCFHVLQGLNELKSQGITPPINMGMMPEYRDKIHICNYRFIREFTKGVDGEWTINKLNHFKPSDYIT